MTMVLYSYNISPYCTKIRAILDHKGLRYREEFVHPLKRGSIQEKSGQWLLPMLEDNGRFVHDSTAIAQYLEDAYPEIRLLPEDPADRARVKLLEEWGDEGLRQVVQPIRWLIPYNFKQTARAFRGAYPEGKANDYLFAAIARGLQLEMARRYGPRFGFGRPARYLNRFAEVMDYLDGLLKPTGFLVGDKPTVADFAVYGFLSHLEGLDGWETLRARRRVAKLVKTLRGNAEDPVKPTIDKITPEAYDMHDQALIDASRLRREKR